MADYNDNYLQSKCEWVNQQHEPILAMNRHALKRIKQSVEKSVSPAGGKALQIIWYYYMTILKVRLKYKTIISVNFVSWHQSTGTLMFTILSH